MWGSTTHTTDLYRCNVCTTDTQFHLVTVSRRGRGLGGRPGPTPHWRRLYSGRVRKGLNKTKGGREGGLRREVSTRGCGERDRDEDVLDWAPRRKCEPNDVHGGRKKLEEVHRSWGRGITYNVFDDLNRRILRRGRIQEQGLIDTVTKSLNTRWCSFVYYVQTSFTTWVLGRDHKTKSGRLVLDPYTWRCSGVRVGSTKHKTLYMKLWLRKD